MPPNEEIRRSRRLIDQISHGFDELESEQRQQLQQAVTVARQDRSDTLGMPRTRHTLPDLTPLKNHVTTNAAAADAMIKGRRAHSARPADVSSARSTTPSTTARNSASPTLLVAPESTAEASSPAPHLKPSNLR